MVGGWRGRVLALVAAGVVLTGSGLGATVAAAEDTPPASGPAESPTETSPVEPADEPAADGTATDGTATEGTAGDGTAADETPAPVVPAPGDAPSADDPGAAPEPDGSTSDGPGVAPDDAGEPQDDAAGSAGIDEAGTEPAGGAAVDTAAAAPKAAAAEEPEAADQPPTLLLDPGDVLLEVDSTCESGYVATVVNVTDQESDVLVRFTAEDGTQVAEQRLTIGAGTEQRSVLSSTATRLDVEVVDPDTDEVLATGSGQRLQCLQVTETCDAVVFTNPAENPAVRLTTFDIEELEVDTEAVLAPGEALRVEFADVEWDAVAEADDSLGAGEGYASATFETCPGTVGLLEVGCSAAGGADGTIEAEVAAVAGARTTWEVTGAAGLLAAGTADDPVAVAGLAVGTYRVTALVDGRPSDEIELRVPTCLSVVTTCDSATFNSAASNPDAVVGFFPGLDDPDAVDPFPIDDIESLYNVVDLPAGESVTVDLDAEEHEWASLQSFAAVLDPDDEFPGTVWLGEGALPAAERCPAADDDPAPVVDRPTHPTPRTPHGSSLADTGGPSGLLGAVGVSAVLAGGALLRRRHG